MRNKHNKERIIEEARMLGIADETKIRNIRIRDEYNELRTQKIKYFERVHQLADKYFLGVKAIESIISQKT